MGEWVCKIDQVIGISSTLLLSQSMIISLDCPQGVEIYKRLELKKGRAAFYQAVFLHRVLQVSAGTN